MNIVEEHYKSELINAIRCLTLEMREYNQNKKQ